MKKTLDTTEIMNELRGQSAFFPNYRKERQSEEQPTSPSELQNKEQEETPVPKPTKLIESKQTSNIASKRASTLAKDIDFIALHKTLKLIGKEVLYVRLTLEEKNQVADIEYTYQRQGIKTSGNEIGRIALNVLLADYKTNGEHSILAKMLAEIHT